MKNFKTPLLFGLALVCLFVVSCSQPARKAVPAEETVESEYRVAIELILNAESAADSLLTQLDDCKLDRYQWKNHVVLFGEAADTTGMSACLSKSGMLMQVKYYNAPMYVFDRNKNCGDSTVAQPWNDYLLTANLVDDSLAQAEYVHSHAVQFDEWPEVAEGFCYAGFQQLLVFKTGRQLLLVISVPEGKTLEELDPKTVENNPRMIEWNTKMGKFQEGIEGTAPGETWVFLQKQN